MKSQINQTFAKQKELQDFENEKEMEEKELKALEGKLEAQKEEMEIVKGNKKIRDWFLAVAIGLGTTFFGIVGYMNK